ncbi:hypothetical protein VTN00DRAFT_3866 [Thermoascus crustaceus]|uniref:uncharacterized protein n=1 Tax=Thermoascus crustaceus TaxID=5088 RepID=UPI0037435890
MAPGSIGGTPPKTRREPNDGSDCKWEDNPALRHGCAICQTCLNNPRAKKTCYGKHAEPCIRYHQTMFRIGRSHSCDACKNSNELHGKRHREIAMLIKKIQEIDEVEDAATTTSKARRKSSCNEAPTTDKVQMEEDKENVGINEGSSKTPPRLSGRSGLSDRCSISSCPLLPSSDGSKAKQIRLQKLAARHAKAATKVLERQAQANSLTVTAESLEEVDIAIHGHPMTLSTEDREEFNVSLRSEIQDFKRLQQDTADENAKQKKAAKLVDQEKDSLQSKYIVSIISKLGVNPPIDEGSKERRILIGKLGYAIKADIETVANEAKETMKRQTAYWRYVNKKMYNNMVRNNELVNWETGEKLQELELEDDEKEDGENS